MKISFSLCWAKGNVTAKSFKQQPCFDLLKDYTDRTSKFCAVTLSSFDLEKESRPAGKVWFCHTSKNSKQLSSEELAREIQKLQNSGARELEILIGPPDGFMAKHLEKFSPDFLWSFGPMTLPHELASVVAAEQLYRAFTILNHHPYHSGH